MKEFIRLRVVRTVEEEVEYTPDRGFHGNEISLVEIAEIDMQAIINGEINADDLGRTTEQDLEVNVEICDYGVEEPEFFSANFHDEDDLEDELIEDEY